MHLYKIPFCLRSLAVSVLFFGILRVMWMITNELQSIDDFYWQLAVRSGAIIVGGLIGYVLSGRKIGFVAACSMAVMGFGVYSLLFALAHSLLAGIVLTCLGIIICAGVFYGIFYWLSRVKMRWLWALVGFVISFIFGTLGSVSALYLIRMNFVS